MNRSHREGVFGMSGRKTTMIEQVQPTNEQEKAKKNSRRANGEASVRKRDDGRFEARVSLPDGRRKSVYGETRKEVLAKARELQQQIELGTYVPSSREMVADYLQHWLNMKRLKWGEGTYVTQR